MEQIRVNKPGQNGGSSRILSEDMSSMSDGKRHSRLPWIILIVVIVLVVAGVLFRDRFSGLLGKESGVTSKDGKVSEYSAVFLNNSQVYFGKLSDVNKQYVLLEDIYYLQVKQDPPLQGQGATSQQPRTEISLVKLGNELHGPTNEMWINRDHVLFYESMKEDSQVVKGIRDYQANPNGSNQTNTTPQSSGGSNQAPRSQSPTGNTQTAPANNTQSAPTGNE